MHLGGVEPLLRHERLGAMRRALAFAADAVDVDVVSYQIGDIDFGRLAREGGQTNAATTIDHARGLVDRFRCPRTFDDIIDALAAIELADGGDRVLVLGVDNVVGAKFEANPKAVVARSG